MKYVKILTFAFIALIFSSCVDQTLTSEQMKEEGFKTYVFDNCEYIGYQLKGQTGLFTHKGNCKFCEQRKAR